MTSPRRRLADSRRSTDPRVGFVALRRRGGGPVALRRIATSRASAASRLRNWERSSEAVITSIVVFGYVFLAVEAFARRRLVSFLASTLLILAIVAVALFLVDVIPQYWKIAVSALFAVAALALLAGNLGDLHRGWRRGGAIRPPPPGETREGPEPDGN